MDGPEWRDVQRVVDGALDRSPESRDAYIDEACGGNDRLRESAKRLVEGCDRAQRAGGILASPAMHLRLHCSSIRRDRMRLAPMSGTRA